MSSTWLRDRASLDDSIALLNESVGKLHAAQPIDIPEIARQLGAAADSIRNLQAFVSSEAPEASWQNRDELDALLDKVQQTLDARAIEQLRSRLLDLAAELERGTILHRRELRVEQVNQLREQAIDELLDHAGAEGAPPPLPGPDAPGWVEWASELKEPEDTESLQMLRNGFARLDDFVANLEPGMWVVGPDAAAQQAKAQAQAAEDEERQKTLRARLLSLADEPERGSIVHHRAFRVNQLMQLRDEAVAELRSQADASGTPQTLPGPGAEQWVAWACLLKEPEDAESLQLLRNGFAHLDDFVTNLEPNMWLPAGAQRQEGAQEIESAPPAAETSRPQVHEAIPVVAAAAGAAAVAMAKAVESEPQASPVKDEAEAKPAVAARSSAKKAAKKAEPSVEQAPIETVVAASESTTNPVKEFLFKSAPDEPLGGKWRMLVAAAAVVVVLLGGIGLWKWHRTHSGINTVQATEKKPSEVTPAVGDSTASQTVIDTANAAHAPGAGAQPNAQAKNQAPGAKPGSTPNPAAAQPGKPANTTPPQQQVTVARLDNGPLRTPTAMPKATPAEDAAAPSGIPGALPSGTGTGPNLAGLNVPVAEPKLAAGKVKVSSGVAQGLLVHQVTPQYPLQARESGIHGTVVVEAVIGKDGSVRSVKAVKGNPLLVKPAWDAVKQWRYKPYYLNGEPIDAETQISVNFNLPSQ